MQVSRFWQRVLLLAAAMFGVVPLFAQVRVQGIVFDGSMTNGLQEVYVTSGSGAIAVTDSLGHYVIGVSETDSIYFSYLGKRTPYFRVKEIANTEEFDISMYGVASINITPLYIKPNSYHLDSLENREEFRELFDYQDGGYMQDAKMRSGRGAGLGVGVDFDMLLTGRAIQKSRSSTQRWMIAEERVNYVDHRFNKTLVKELTGLTPPALDTFMHTYRPSYELLQSFETEVDFRRYIQESGKFFSEEWEQIQATRRSRFINDTL
jgi:hypothetical protein